jgi:hypothetical protein
MKLKPILQILSGLIITPIIALAVHQPSYAGEKFKCDDKLQNPITYAKTSRGWQPMLVWESNYFRTSKQERCRIVTKRLQAYSDNRMLYLRGGKFNGLPVICTAIKKGGNCLKEDVVITLKPEAYIDDRDLTAKVLTEIKYFRNGASKSRPVYLSESKSLSYENGDLYIDLNGILKEE